MKTNGPGADLLAIPAYLAFNALASPTDPTLEQGLVVAVLLVVCALNVADDSIQGAIRVVKSE